MLNRFINLIRSLLMRDKVVNFQSSSVYDEEIKNKERNLELFYDVVGDNPLKHIDWIIENGLEKFNQWYKSYEDGSIRLPQTNSVEEEMILCRSISHDTFGYLSKLTGKRIVWSEFGEMQYIPTEEYDSRFKNSEFVNHIRIVNGNNIEPENEYQSYIGRKIGFMPASREQKEMDSILRQSLSAKDYRLYSPTNEIKVEVEIRGGIGNEVIARYEEVNLSSLF